VVVRHDLPVGMREAQTVHASDESSPGRDFIPKNMHVVVLAVPNEAELAKVETRLREVGVEHAAVREVDPPYSGQLMAIGLFPCFKDDVRQYLSSLPALRARKEPQQ
jgi:hypothetical protein